VARAKVSNLRAERPTQKEPQKEKQVTPVPIRASSLSDLLDCPARWEAKYIYGMRLPSGPRAILGKAVHAGTAVYDLSRIQGTSLTPDEAAGAVVDAIRKPQEEVDWKADEDLKPATVESISLGLHGLYCANVAPKQDYIGVEVTCDALEISDLGLVLTGTTDRVRRDEYGRLGIADLKTGGNAVAADGTVNTKGHGVQLAVYEVLAANATGQNIEAPAQIIGLQTAKTKKGMRVGVGEVQSAMTALVGTEDFPGILEHVSRLIHSGLFHGNPRSQLCSEKYCPAWRVCRFRA
jgi:RecB family exonuclease